MCFIFIANRQIMQVVNRLNSMRPACHPDRGFGPAFDRRPRMPATDRVTGFESTTGFRRSGTG